MGWDANWELEAGNWKHGRAGLLLALELVLELELSCAIWKPLSCVQIRAWASWAGSGLGARFGTGSDAPVRSGASSRRYCKLQSGRPPDELLISFSLLFNP